MTSVVRGDAAPAEGEDYVCAICLAGLFVRPVAKLDCSHRFHAGCTEDWLRKTPHPLCPLCKARQCCTRRRLARSLRRCAALRVAAGGVIAVFRRALLCQLSSGRVSVQRRVTTQQLNV